MKKNRQLFPPQWEKQDFIKMEDFNDAFGKTDAALKERTPTRPRPDCARRPPRAEEADAALKPR